MNEVLPPYGRTGGNAPLTAVSLGVLLASFALVSTAHAGVLTERPCVRGVEPAATLLIPYFEVDLSDPTGFTTLFAVTNVEAQPALARVVLWSDWALPVFAFDLYLTGLDVQTVNLRDVLRGRLPATGAATSPQGNRSDENQSFPGCPEDDVASPEVLIPFLQAALSGQPTHQGCWSSPPDYPGQAKGYVTIDVVNACSVLFPTDEGYFAEGGTGVASNRNTLIGDYFLVDPEEDFAQGEPAVHLVADADFFSPGDATFYRAYVDSNGSDARIPLSSRYASRYVQGGAFTGGTELLVWREVGDPDRAEPGECGAGVRPWLSSGEAKLLFDEEENAALLDEPIALPFFPLAAQRVSLAGRSLWPYGWLQTELSGQAWVTSLLSAESRYSVGYSASRLNDLCSD